MVTASIDEKKAFFDSIADKWDDWDDLQRLGKRLDDGLAQWAVAPNETVVDVGCGTGSLTLALLRRLGPQGRVIAVDLSSRMVNAARRKTNDERVTWIVEAAEELSLAPCSAERIICFSVWPHFADPHAVLDQCWRVLKPRGSLHIWHLISRERVNEIHAGASPAVRSDVLVSAAQLAAMLSSRGFDVYETVDALQRYIVSARKAGE